MPNWCEGSLKVRGTTQDLRNFLVNVLEPVNFLGGKKEPLKVYLDDRGTELTVKTHDGNPDLRNTSLWIRGTRRLFCEPQYIELYVDDDKTPAVLVLPFRAAWCVDPEPLCRLSKEFNVDIRVFGVESGMQFCQDIEILGGEINKNEEIKYDDWDWECPFPQIGG